MILAAGGFESGALELGSTTVADTVRGASWDPPALLRRYRARAAPCS